jgi:superfamily I DNA/RNA helicase
MARYQERLSAYQAVDFDDLIGLPVALLQRDADVRGKWQRRLATCWSTSTRTPTPSSTSC